MQQDLLPLFPLSVVLFPRTQLPLHIFEDRYKEMIGAAARDHSEFGVVLAADRGVANTGCTAVVDRVTNRYDDGRFDIVITGVRRFEILDLNNEKAFLRGSVSYFNDEETSSPSTELKSRAISGYQDLRAFLSQEPAPEPAWEDPQVSFQLAQPINDLEFRQKLLACRSEAGRIHMLADFFPQHIERQRHVSHVRSIAPTDGRGAHPDMS